MSNFGSFEVCHICKCYECKVRHIKCNPCMECNGKSKEYNLKYTYEEDTGYMANSFLPKEERCSIIDEEY